MGLVGCVEGFYWTQRLTNLKELYGVSVINGLQERWAADVSPKLKVDGRRHCRSRQGVDVAYWQFL